MQKINSIHFDIQRKIVANMTSESWETIPHVSYSYEPDVTNFIDFCSKNNLKDGKKITLNTYMLKVITEGLKAAPIMNSHIQFNRKLVRGEISTYKNIDVSLPMILPNGKMMTINLKDLDKKSIKEIQECIEDVRRRAENTNLTEAMFEVSLNDTLKALKKGKIKQAIYRLIGSKTGKYKVKTLSGKERKEYLKIPETDRLTKKDIEQGTTTISNIGSIYKEQKGMTTLLEIIPPQVTAFSVGALQEKPLVVKRNNGDKSIEIRKVLPLCIAFDHRAVDFGDIIPFIKRLDDIFENPEQMKNW